MSPVRQAYKEMISIECQDHASMTAYFVRTTAYGRQSLYIRTRPSEISQKHFNQRQITNKIAPRVQMPDVSGAVTP